MLVVDWPGVRTLRDFLPKQPRGHLTLQGVSLLMGETILTIFSSRNKLLAVPGMFARIVFE